MSSNRDLAGLLALYSASYGDWRKLFTALDDLNQVKAEDVQRAANRYFVATGRTTVSDRAARASPTLRRRRGRRSAGPEARNEDSARHSPSGGRRPCAGRRHSGIGRA